MLEMIEVREVLYPDTPLYISVDSIVMIKGIKLGEGASPQCYIETTNSMLFVFGDAKEHVTALASLTKIEFPEK